MLADYLAAGDAPVAVAFSGGGDSTALLHMIVAQAGNRDVFAFIVDHGLRANSEGESSLVAKRARDMGAKPEILVWDGEKPVTAIQEQARLARYALMGAMCRKNGVTQLFLGHNQDDQAETVWMRAQNGSGWRGLAGMAERSRAPIWPQLYDVDVIRPLLSVTRAQLRQYNASHALDYIDDPSNENAKFMRVRARGQLNDFPKVKAQCIQISKDAQQCLREERQKIRDFIQSHAKIQEWGGVYLRSTAIASNGTVFRQGLKLIIQAVSGQGYAPQTEKIQALAKQICGPNFQGATLGGVQCLPHKAGLLIVRDPGMVMGRNGKPMNPGMFLQENVQTVWDGRFGMTSVRAGLSAVPLMSLYQQLDDQEKQTLKQMPYAARAGLPACVKQGLYVGSLLGAPSNICEIHSLIAERLSNLLGE